MKNINTIFKLFFVSILLVACSTEDPAELDSSLHVPDVVTPPVSAGTFTGIIDGTDYTIDIVTAVLDLNVQSGVVPTILITAKRGNEVISLRMPTDIAVNSVTNPYVLGGAASTYAAFYNTDVTTISEATILSDLHMTFDNSLWMADTPLATVSGGVTTVRGIKGANGESVNLTVQDDQTGSYTFGATNLANYNAGGAGADVFDADMTADNGSISLEIDDLNKLISGTFSFDGTETYTSSYTVPNGVDTDGDGMFDGVESNLGYDPNSACSPIQPVGYTGFDAANAIWMAADCDNDGITNEDEINGPDGDPLTTADNTDPYEGQVDTDGDGISDTQEDLDGSDSTDPCSPAQLEKYTGYDILNTIWGAADCDGDTVSNIDEVNGPDGDPLTTADNTDPYFLDFLNKSFTEGSFSKVPYAQPVVKRGLNISTHNTTDKKIIGTYSFISASIGETPTRWYVVTEGTFDVTYTVIPVQ